MPPGYIRHENIWKKILKIYVNISGVWKIIDRGYKNVSGTWKLLHTNLPNNIIGLFDADPGGEWDLCDGIDDPLDLITADEMYMRGSDDEEIPASAHAHTHASSGFGSTGTVSSSQANDPSPDEGTLQDDDHTHTSPSHGHGSTNHEPLHYTLIPCVNGKTLPANTLLFYNGAVAPTGWTADETLYDHFIKCAGIAAGPLGAASHSHTITGIYTGWTLSVQVSRALNNSAMQDINHRHGANHTHLGGNNYPAWHGLLPVRCNSEEGYIPSGIVAFFKSNVVPYGWSLCDGNGGTPNLQDKFIYCRAGGDVGSTGGANTHTHSHSGMNTQTYGTNGSWAYPNGTYVAKAHSHPWPGGNHQTQTSIPLHRPLLICIKD